MAVEPDSARVRFPPPFAYLGAQPIGQLLPVLGRVRCRPDHTVHGHHPPSGSDRLRSARLAAGQRAQGMN